MAKQAVTPRERVHAGLLVFVFSALWIVLSGLFTFISVQVIFNQAEPVISSLIIAFILLYVVVNFEFVSERGIGAFTIPVRLSQRQLETWKIATGAVLFVWFVAIVTIIVILAQQDHREIFGVQVHPITDVVLAVALTFLVRVFVWLPFTPLNLTGQDSVRRHRASPPRGLVPPKN